MRQIPASALICRRPRSGAATVWLLVVMGVLGTLLTTITVQHLAGRRSLDQRFKQIQADWLARAGVELAVARLLNDPAEYTGEATKLLAGSSVRFTVRRDSPAELELARGAGTLGLMALPRGLAAPLTVAGQMHKRDDATGAFVISSEARYRSDEPQPVVRTLTRRYRRVVDRDAVRLERGDGK